MDNDHTLVSDLIAEERFNLVISGNRSINIRRYASQLYFRFVVVQKVVE